MDTPKPLSPTYYARMTSEPVESTTRASHMHYLNASDPVVSGLERIRDNHAEKFSQEELDALAVARKILESAQVPMALIDVKPERRLRRRMSRGPIS